MEQERQNANELGRHLLIRLARRGLHLMMAELGPDVIRQPALEMLFDLYEKPASQTRYLTALSSLPSGSERNSQRIIHRMVEHSLLKIGRDDSDGRRLMVELDDAGRQSLDRFIDLWMQSPEFAAIVDAIQLQKPEEAQVNPETEEKT